ncbi:MAG: aldo/keto reductase [Bacillota bacterium]
MKPVIPLKYSELGRTGLSVSQLCFGSLALGPAQHDLSLSRSRELLMYAWHKGVNFFDTAELYGTYPHLRCVSELPGAVIASRSYAVTGAEMRDSFDLCRRELGRDTLDIFGLHEQESGLTLKGHGGALKYLESQKAKGNLKAISVSTHSVDCVRAAAMRDDVDIVFALLNVAGLGIRNGTREDMEEALRFAVEAGKGVYLMKVLGGGHLHREAERALAYAASFPWKASVCVGLCDEYEVECASRVLTGEKPPEAPVLRLDTDRRLFVEDWCEACGKCVERCPFGALSILGDRVSVDAGKCMLCGYCARACPHFCLKVVRTFGGNA